jgi:cytochrome b pre-mRNA-processing protein 3
MLLLLRRLFGPGQADPRDALRPLYAADRRHARQPHWYLSRARFPIHIDGRFEMVATHARRWYPDPARIGSVPGRRDRTCSPNYSSTIWTHSCANSAWATWWSASISGLIGRTGRQAGRVSRRTGCTGTERHAFEAAIWRNLYAGMGPGGEQIAHVVAGLRLALPQLASYVKPAILALPRIKRMTALPAPEFSRRRAAYRKSVRQPWSRRPACRQRRRARRARQAVSTCLALDRLEADVTLHPDGEPIWSEGHLRGRGAAGLHVASGEAGARARIEEAAQHPLCRRSGP